ncbi:hypothetical protein [Nocardioides pakistanensis]
MTDTTAKIRAKGLNATGVTEEIATRLADAESGHLIAVVELKVEEVHKKVDGERRVDLIITTLEPATEKIAEDHLREFQRALYYNRAVDEAQPTLDSDGPEPTVAEVLGRGTSLLEHDDQGDVVGLWDGNTDPDDGPGTTGEELQMLGAPFPGDNPDDDQPHAFVGDDTKTDGSRNSCVRCGRFRGEDDYAHTDDAPVPA